MTKEPASVTPEKNSIAAFKVDTANAGKRLDRYLTEHFPQFASRAYVQRLIAGKKVLVNNSPRKNHYRLEAGDCIKLEIPAPVKLEIRAEKIPIKIIYEDDRIIVVDKPAGMVVHPAPGNYTGTLVNALLYYSKNLSPSKDMKPGIVHRLDKDTSGILIVAKDEASHAFLARQFNKRTMDKRYTAVVEGIMELDNGVISEPIGRHPRDRKKMCVRVSESRPAVTRYKVLERLRGGSLVEVKPETGRTHQIRVHMAYVGHPVMGDATYGSKRHAELISRQALHASGISFLHPDTKAPMKFESRLPADMKNLIAKLRLE